MLGLMKDRAGRHEAKDPGHSVNIAKRFVFGAGVRSLVRVGYNLFQPFRCKVVMHVLVGCRKIACITKASYVRHGIKNEVLWIAVVIYVAAEPCGSTDDAVGVDLGEGSGDRHSVVTVVECVFECGGSVS